MQLDLKSNFTRGVITIIGGIFIHLVLGSFYLWGSIDIYVSSYFRVVYDHNLNGNITQIVSPVMLLALSCGLPFGSRILKKLGKRWTCMILGLSLSAAIFISSFLENFWGFVIMYGIGFGIFGGLIYMIPVFSAVQFFPNKKGVVSGIIIGAFGFGSLVTNFIALAIVNPDNTPASKFPDSGDKYFPWSIAQQLPSCLRYLSLYYACLMFTGSLLILDPVETSDKTKEEKRFISSNNRNSNSDSEGAEPLLPSEERPGKKNPLGRPEGQKTEEAQSGEEKEITIKDGFKSFTFYVEFLMIFFTSGYGLFLANNFKNYGILHINNDQFLTLVGSLGSAANAGSRVVWGLLLDRFPFRNIYFALVVIQLVMVATLNLIADTKALYLIWIFISLGCEGGHFALFPPLTMKIFGTKTGTVLYGFIYFAFFFANGLQFLIVFFYKESLTYTNILWIYVGITAVGILLAAVFKPRP